jgi:diguanylate cyclase (GGDEF)-like protein/PAS domain S-box-containing protein
MPKIFEDIRAMQALVDVLPIAIFVKDAASKFQLMNKACEAQWGMSFADLQGTDGSQFFPPEQMEWFLAKDRKIFSGGSQVDFEEAFWNASLKQNRVGHTFKNPIYDASGNPLYLICVTIDITDSQTAHKELLLSEEKLRTMFDMSALGMARNSMDGKFIEANKAFLNIVGHSLVKLNQLSYWDLTPESYAELEALQLESLRTKFRYGPYEKEYISSSGQRVPVRLNGVQITGSDGEKYIWSIVEDVTERRLNEKTLSDSNKRLGAVLRAVPDLMFELDRNGRYLNVWGIRDDLLAAPGNQLLGHTVEEMLSPAAAQEVLAAIAEAEVSGHSLGRQIKRSLPQGDCWFELSVARLAFDSKNEISFIVLSRDITERKHSEKQIHQLAFFDPLTQLPNRRLLMDRLQQAFSVSARNGQHGAVMFIDLDNFKTLNDSKGHDFGDILLIEVAKRLSSCVRDGDTVARLGGDEFVIVLETLSRNQDEAATQVESVAGKIQVALNAPYQLQDHMHHSTSSIGIILFRGHLENLDNLLKYADTAMYQAKAAGRNTVRFFDPNMQAALEARAELESEMRQALSQQQFSLHYQIQVDSLRNPLGAEALIRWTHPQRGLISPAQFIPLAEESGLIIPIGLWVLQSACAQLKAWQKNPKTASLALSVNVSAKQFQQVDFVAQVKQVLSESGAQPSLLKLELTESTLLDKVEEAIAKMQELIAVGVRFSIDDFGTGYSSLQYLKRLPIYQIKIDQAFVRDIASDPNDAAIVKAIIAMAEALGLNAIAEGVESEDQFNFLEKHGCHAHQGYLFSKPVPLAAFEKALPAWGNV